MANPPPVALPSLEPTASAMAALADALDAKHYTNKRQVQEIWVDQAAGHDSNNGSQGAPVQTIDAALDLVPVCGRAEITLNGNGLYTMTRRHAVNFKAILMKAAPGVAASDRPNYPRLTPLQIAGGFGGCDCVGAFFTFDRIDLRPLGSADTGPSGNGPVGALLQSGAQGSVWVSCLDASVNLREVAILRVAAGGFGAMAWQGGYLIDNSNIVGPTLLQIDGGLAALTIESAYLTGMSSATEAVRGVNFAADGEPTNLLSNLSF